MEHRLLREIEMGSKSALMKKRIITYYIYNGCATITDPVSYTHLPHFGHNYLP